MSRNTPIEFHKSKDLMRGPRQQEIDGAHHPVSRTRVVFIAGMLLLASVCQGLALTAKDHFKFVNVVDSTQGYSGFSQFPAINNRGAVAFFANRISGGEGIFVEHLLGSIVTGLDLERFGLNDHNQLAFQYGLQDGGSGIAIASLHQGSKEDCESER